MLWTRVNCFKTSGIQQSRHWHRHSNLTLKKTNWQLSENPIKPAVYTIKLNYSPFICVSWHCHSIPDPAADNCSSETNLTNAQTNANFSLKGLSVLSLHLSAVDLCSPFKAKCKSSTKLTISSSPASQRVSLCVSVTLFTLLGDSVCAFPNVGSPWSAPATLTLQAQSVRLSRCNRQLMGAFQHHVNRN